MSPEAREPYETLAGAYDGLTTDVDYAAVLQFFETVLQRAGHSPKTVLDLACGTGSMSVLLAERGYRVTGADISEEMLTAAAQKAAAMAENPPFFICQPMQRLTLPEPVEAIVCLLDSLNYLTEPGGLPQDVSPCLARAAARRHVLFRHQHATKAARAGRAGLPR